MLRRAAALLALVVLVACGDGDGDGDAGDAGPDDAGSTTPSLAEGTWTEVPGGGNTACAPVDGEPFAFFVYPGKVNKVVIDFAGGGACWNEQTCTGGQNTEDLSSTRATLAGAAGIYDKARTDNPVDDWFHVVVPYCTGDVHWGDNVATYAGQPYLHRGAVNARAVLDWVYRNFSRPEAILVTGCSAGAYGSIMWAPQLQQHYADVPVYQLGDSGAGVTSASFFADALPNWRFTAAAPAFIPALDPARVDWAQLTLAQLYVGVGQHFPGMQLSQFNTEADFVQRLFLALMGGDPATWSAQMRASRATIGQGTPNFSSFLAPGTQHCVITNDNFYTLRSGGVRMVDFVEDLVSGRPPPEVRCTGCDGGT
jgi:Pectinacetylesterase